MKLLVVVDMQNDFITGALGSPDAQSIVPRVREKVEAFQGEVVFTMDTHSDDYLRTQEGRKLPVPHCIKGTEGWEICDELFDMAKCRIEKPTFGYVDFPKFIMEKMGEAPEEIELVGLCTDICVISNAMILKAAFPEIPVSVDSTCCAGVTPQSHQNALRAMESVQIEVR